MQGIYRLQFRDEAKMGKEHVLEGDLEQRIRVLRKRGYCIWKIEIIGWKKEDKSAEVQD